jgi:predicted nucleotidyltransferase
VKLKRYFYVLRPLLALRYLLERKGVPPVRFEELVHAVAPEHLHQAIADLLELKRKTPEIGYGDAIPELGAFIQSELSAHESRFAGKGRSVPLDGVSLRSQLNDLFRDVITKG